MNIGLTKWKQEKQETVDVAGGEIVQAGTEAAAPENPKPKKVRQHLFARFRRESKRDRQLAVLTDGYQQLLGLMSSIQMHLESQTQNQKHLANAMEQLPDVADGLKKMGSAAEQQTEVMGLMREQLGSSVQHDQQLVNSMKRFNRTLATMNGIFLLVLLAGLASGIYFSLNDSAKSSLVEKAKSLFESETEPVAESVGCESLEEPPALPVAGDPDLSDEAESKADENPLPQEPPAPPLPELPNVEM